MTIMTLIILSSRENGASGYVEAIDDDDDHRHVLFLKGGEGGGEGVGGGRLPGNKDHRCHLRYQDNYVDDGDEGHRGDGGGEQRRG